MAGNVNPQYTRQGNIGSVLVTAANTSSQGGGTVATDIFKACTVDATNGSFIEFVRFIATATAPTTTTATVGRVFYSTVGSGGTTSANTYLLGEITLPAVGADNASAAAPYFDLPINFRCAAGSFIHVTNHAAPAANSAWRAVVVGGDY